MASRGPSHSKPKWLEPYERGIYLRNHIFHVLFWSITSSGQITKPSSPALPQVYANGQPDNPIPADHTNRRHKFWKNSCMYNGKDNSTYFHRFCSKPKWGLVFYTLLYSWADTLSITWCNLLKTYFCIVRSDKILSNTLIFLLSSFLLMLVCMDEKRSRQ